MHYSKITLASKISFDLLGFYLLSYCDINNTNVTKFTRSELISKVESAELSRRAKRAKRAKRNWTTIQGNKLYIRKKNFPLHFLTQKN